MPAEENGKAVQYHGPPNQNRDIVSYNVLALDAELNHRTAFSYRQRRHRVPLHRFAKRDWR